MQPYHYELYHVKLKWYETKSFSGTNIKPFAEPPSLWGSQSAGSKPLPRLFLDPSYGPECRLFNIDL